MHFYQAPGDIGAADPGTTRTSKGVKEIISQDFRQTSTRNQAHHLIRIIMKVSFPGSPCVLISKVERVIFNEYLCQAMVVNAFI